MKTFALEPELEANRPPAARDGVRLLVSQGDRQELTTFLELPRFLGAGDLLVYNDSATLPAALKTPEFDLHLSTPDPGDADLGWIVEPRRRPELRGWFALPDGAGVEIGEPFRGSSRLRRARLQLGGRELLDYLNRWGRPITYAYIQQRFPLRDYQTIFARKPGSAEMPSAGRPFTRRVLESLEGVELAPVTLHCGVSSLEGGETPYPERFQVPDRTWKKVLEARRVIAIGTSVVRALESRAVSGRWRGWTEHVVTRQSGLRTVDGLITGLHEPEATHLDMLRALAADHHLERAYQTALQAKMLWHEFGDLHLLWSEAGHGRRAKR